MDPELQPKPQSHEQAAEIQQSREQQPLPEQQMERPQFDSESQANERAPQSSSAAPVIDPSDLAVAQPTITHGDAGDTATKPNDDLPLLASDDDLIEKEWVDKAKQVIAETKDDPNRREKEIARLQADYLRKRYGKELGADENA